MKHKKKKRSKPSKPPAPAKGEPVVANTNVGNSNRQKVLNCLMDAFASVSMEEAADTYREENGDPNKAAEILSNLCADCSEDETAICSGSTEGSCSCSTSSASEVFVVNNCVSNGVREKVKPRKVIAATGMVSTMLSKDYVRSTVKKDSLRNKGYDAEAMSKADSEQFLCSMLGDNCELSMAVVKDVLCQFEYDVEKALNVLLELSSTSSETLKFSGCNNNGTKSREQSGYFLESSDNSTDRASDSSSHSSERDLQDNFWSISSSSRNDYTMRFAGYEGQSSMSPKSSNLELPQMVLESLFCMPKRSENEPNTLNWRNLVKKMESLPRFEPCLSDIPQQHNHAVAKGDEYQLFREAAKQDWDSVKIFYQKAATAYTKGERDYAACLSDKGRLYSKKAREADEKASQDIFEARNKTIENVITIDLHGQHVKQAMRLLKLHLLFGAYVRSVRTFRVITGCGTHGVGKSIVKQSVINLLEKEGIGWSEENRGTLLIRLNGQTEFGFLDNDSDSG